MEKSMALDFLWKLLYIVTLLVVCFIVGSSKFALTLVIAIAR